MYSTHFHQSLWKMLCLFHHCIHTSFNYYYPHSQFLWLKKERELDVQKYKELWRSQCHIYNSKNIFFTVTSIKKQQQSDSHESTQAHRPPTSLVTLAKRVADDQPVTNTPNRLTRTSSHSHNHRLPSSPSALFTCRLSRITSFNIFRFPVKYNQSIANKTSPK